MPEARSYSAEELHTGLKVAYERDVTEEDVLTFARLTGDCNPLHVDAAYAKLSNYEGRITHGAFQVGLASALLGMNLPGKKVLLGSINSRFPHPLYFPARITLTGEIASWNPAKLSGQLRVVIQEASSSNTTAEIFMGFTLHEDKRPWAVENAKQFATEGERSLSAPGKKLLLLTGASGGLGSRIVSSLAGEYQLLAVVNQHPLTKELRSLPDVREVASDISAPEFEADLDSVIGEQPVYGVIHAAWPGAGRGSLLQSDHHTIQDQLAFGSTIPISLARTLFKRAPSEGGRLIAIGSTAGTAQPLLQMGVYSLGKACLEHAVKLLAPELARKKITANVVCPSFVPVGINKQATERQVMMESAATPMGRVCDVDDVLGMIRYLLSPEAAFVSGQILALTGARL